MKTHLLCRLVHMDCRGTPFVSVVLYGLADVFIDVHFATIAVVWLELSSHLLMLDFQENE